MNTKRALVLVFGALMGAAVVNAIWRRNRLRALEKCETSIYRVRVGAHIEDAAAEACELACDCELDIVFVFNEIPVKVMPGMDLESVMNCYNIGLMHAEEEARLVEKTHLAADPTSTPSAT